MTDNLTALFGLSGSTCANAACIMLVKLTPGLNFTNVLSTAFTLADPESVKRYLDFVVLFTLLGPTSIKVIRKTLVKLTADRDVTSSKIEIDFRR